MNEKFLEDVRSCIKRFSRAAEKGMSGRDERLLKEIHHLCCLIVDRDNGMGIAALREIAQKLASLSGEFRGHDEFAAAIYNFGSGFASSRQCFLRDDPSVRENLTNGRMSLDDRACRFLFLLCRWKSGWSTGAGIFKPFSS